MDSMRVIIDDIFEFATQSTVQSMRDTFEHNQKVLHNKIGKGSDFLGWLDLPSSISHEELNAISQCANDLRAKSEIVVVVGIGGSYLGAKAVLEALNHSFSEFLPDKSPHIIFAGHHICEDYHAELLQLLDNRFYSIVVISKSGTTTEPAIAFRLLKQHLENKVGKAEASKRIVAITDASKGALLQQSQEEGYKTFVIPDDVGGRYSVLTPVGLLPIALAGFDITQLVEGAKKAQQQTGQDTPFEQNVACLYAAARNALYQQGYGIEIMVNYTPKLHYLTEWWKQLYGESEGKNGKGIFPAGVNFTTDLHSLGQYIQDGQRNLFETVINVADPNHTLTIPEDDKNLDELNYISGKRLSQVNEMALKGTTLAHLDGKVPIIHIEIPKINEFWLGYLMYFYEKACALSGYYIDVNPFDQPGVEAYKKNMFALLGKKGFEEQGKLLREILND